MNMHLVISSVSDWESKQAGWQRTIRVLTHISQNAKDLLGDEFVGNDIQHREEGLVITCKYYNKIMHPS